MSYSAPSPEQEAFARRLRVAREVHGFSQTHLAALLGVSLPRYHAWETGFAGPNNFALYAGLCRSLHVTVEWLFFGNAASLSDELRERLEAALRAVELLHPPPAG